jgi:hypothetical protein
MAKCYFILYYEVTNTHPKLQGVWKNKIGTATSDKGYMLMAAMHPVDTRRCPRLVLGAPQRSHRTA